MDKETEFSFHWLGSYTASPCPTETHSCLTESASYF